MDHPGHRNNARTRPPEADWLNLIGEAFLYAFGGAFGLVNAQDRSNREESDLERGNLGQRGTSADGRNGSKP